MAAAAAAAAWRKDESESQAVERPDSCGLAGASVGSTLALLAVTEARSWSGLEGQRSAAVARPIQQGLGPIHWRGRKALLSEEYELLGSGGRSWTAALLGHPGGELVAAAGLPVAVGALDSQDGCPAVVAESAVVDYETGRLVGAALAYAVGSRFDVDSQVG